METTCFGCGSQNSEGHIFCGQCGSPLSLSSYINDQVDARLAEATRDREIVEKESAIRIFEKAYGWAKLLAGACGALIAILAIGATWRFLDLRSAVNSAETAVASTRSAAEKSIAETAASATTQSKTSLETIKIAASKATDSSTLAQRVAQQQSKAITGQTEQLRRGFQTQAEAVGRDIASARQQIQSANELQPQMASMQQQLVTAQEDIKKQQEVITSSEEFAKKIFSSHKVFSFDSKTADKASFAVISSTLNGKPVRVLYLLLPFAAVPETLQLQFRQMVAAPNSFGTFHNLFVAYLEPLAEQEILGSVIQVGYFPDPSDKVVIRTLTVDHDRVFADGEALPKFPGIDAEFQGSKWFPAAPVPPPATPKQAP